jgi:hypothetical protein
MNLVSRKRFAWTVALAAAIGVMVAPAAFASTGLGTPLTTKTQAMEGDLKVAQGSTLSVGYGFKMPGQHPQATVRFMGTRVTFAATCASGTPGSQTIVVEPPDQSYNDPANSTDWYPSDDQNDASTYQGSTTVPSFCDPGALVRLKQGGTFTTNVSSTDTQDRVMVRWHYKNGTEGGWSGTYSVIPSVATVCTVTNTRTNLVYSTLQSAQDAASNGDTVTVENTCKGATTISHSLTIDGVDGTNPTLDGNQEGSVLTFGKFLTYTVTDLTIQGGRATDGGGVYINDDSTFTFDHVTVSNNVAERLGGGFYIDDGSTGEINYSIVVNDKGDVVGGVAVVGATVTITGSTINFNTTVSDTAAVSHKLDFTGTITSGTYKLSLDGETIATALNYDATAEQIQAALESLTNTNPGDVRVIGTYPGFEIRYFPLGERKRDLSLTDSALVGGGSGEITGVPYQTAAIKFYSTTGGSLETLSSSITAVDSDVGDSLALGDVFFSTDSTSTGSVVRLPGPACVTNQATRMGFPTLQSAVDSALPGEVLQLVGTCYGQTKFTRDVVVQGPGVLDGEGDVTPVVVAQSANVGLTDLSITNGVGDLGGGIRNDGTILLARATVSGNKANDKGGGIYNTGGMQISNNCSITSNTAGSVGGGIYNSGGVLDHSCTISHNSAVDGGGVATTGRVFEMRQATIDGNTASGRGGGVYHLGGNLTLNDGSTITGNTASAGGGVFKADPSLPFEIDDTSSVTGNTPDDIP